MGELERLIEVFGAEGKQTAVSWKLDVLLDLVRLPDAGVVEFLLQVLTNPVEPTDVRIEVLKRLRNGRLTLEERPLVAEVILRILSDFARTSPALSIQAALALGEFTDVPGVVEGLGNVACTTTGAFDLRYAAFTSLERSGPSPEAIDAFRRLTLDDVLGRSGEHSSVVANLVTVSNIHTGGEDGGTEPGISRGWMQTR